MEKYSEPEKVLADSQITPSETDSVIDWSAEEERRLVRKLAAMITSLIETDLFRIDFIVMSLLILGFFALQLDRGNM
jgi:hypothetical protein